MYKLVAKREVIQLYSSYKNTQFEHLEYMVIMLKMKKGFTHRNRKKKNVRLSGRSS